MTGGPDDPQEGWLLRQIARGLAGLNAVYQGAMGLISIASPQSAAKVYQLSPLSPSSAALSRILGGLMVGNALVLALFARDPEGNTGVASLLLAGCGANLASDVVACRAGELRWRQVVGSMGFQAALGAALGAYLASAHSSPQEAA